MIFCVFSVLAVFSKVANEHYIFGLYFKLIKPRQEIN